MGFFSDAINNAVSSTKDFVAAPAAATSNFLDKSPMMIAINPVNWVGSQAVKQSTGLSYSEQLAIGAAGGATAGAFGYTGLSEQATMLAAQEAGMATWYETLGLGPEGLGLLGKGGLLTALWPSSLAGAAASAGAAAEAYDKYAPKGGAGAAAGAKIGGKVGGGIPPLVIGVGVLAGAFFLWKALK